MVVLRRNPQSRLLMHRIARANPTGPPNASRELPNNSALQHVIAYTNFLHLAHFTAFLFWRSNY